MDYQSLPQDVRNAVSEISDSAAFLNKLDPDKRFFKKMASESDTVEEFVRKIKHNIEAMQSFADASLTKDALNPKNWDNNERVYDRSTDWQDLPQHFKEAIFEITDKTRVVRSFQSAMMRMIFELLRNSKDRASFVHNMFCLLDDLEEMTDEWRNNEDMDDNNW